MIKLIDILFEWSYSQLFGKTPDQYKDRSRNIRVKLKTINRGRYYYQTTTLENNNVHNQLIKPRPGKQLKSINDNVIVLCDCEDFKYENEWLLWKNNSSNIVNSNGQPLKVKNPENILKLCKHLVAIGEDLKKRIR